MNLGRPIRLSIVKIMPKSLVKAETSRLIEHKFFALIMLDRRSCSLSNLRQFARYEEIANKGIERTFTLTEQHRGKGFVAASEGHTTESNKITSVSNMLVSTAKRK